MKFSEVLDVLKDQTLYVGARSSFLFIGTVEEYRLIQTRLDRKLKNNLKELAQTHKRTYEAMLESGDGEKIRKAEEAYEESKKNLKGFVPLAEREVLDYYPRVRGGVAIIVEGDEVGRFWLRSEFEEELKKERKKMKGKENNDNL